MRRRAIDGTVGLAHALRMPRRDFLKVTSGVAAHAFLGACASRAGAPPSSPSSRARAIAFDLFTIFDPRSVIRAAETVLSAGAAELCASLRTRQFEYSWLLAAADRYADFATVTDQALVYAARDRHIALSQEQRRVIVDAHSALEPWPDTREQLVEWKRAGLRLAPLSNYSPAMLGRLVRHADLAGVFDLLISSEAARTFKPSPRAYALGPALLGMDRREIVFAAFGGWDAAGAKWFGFPTFWVNRLGVTEEALPPAPDATGATLAQLAAFVGA